MAISRGAGEASSDAPIGGVTRYPAPPPAPPHFMRRLARDTGPRRLAPLPGIFLLCALRGLRRHARRFPPHLRPQTGAFADSREHSRAEFFVVMKSEDNIGPFPASERSMRSRLALHDPATSRQSGEHAPRLGGGPVAHAALKVTFKKSEGVSRCSNRSAITRSARACTLATASARPAP